MAVAHEVICQMKFIAISSDGNYIHQESCTRSKAAAVENIKIQNRIERTVNAMNTNYCGYTWLTTLCCSSRRQIETLESNNKFHCFLLLFFVCFTANEKCVYDFRPNNSQYGPVLRMLFQRIRRSLFLSLSLSHSFANNNNN